LKKKKKKKKKNNKKGRASRSSGETIRQEFGVSPQGKKKKTNDLATEKGGGEKNNPLGLEAGERGEEGWKRKRRASIKNKCRRAGRRRERKGNEFSRGNDDKGRRMCPAPRKASRGLSSTKKIWKNFP